MTKVPPSFSSTDASIGVALSYGSLSSLLYFAPPLVSARDTVTVRYTTTADPVIKSLNKQLIEVSSIHSHDLSVLQVFRHPAPLLSKPDIMFICLRTRESSRSSPLSNRPLRHLFFTAS